jgi:putative transposase
MADYRRYYVLGATYFFTVVTQGRAPVFHSAAARRILGVVLRETRERWPFEIVAIVLLPDHLHSIWTLSVDDDRYSLRWAWIKKEFTKRWLAAGGTEQVISPQRQARERCGVWQPRFWEHTIRDEDDFERHFDYVHFNAVKHGLVDAPWQWPHSSFHRWVRDGVYPSDWAAGPDARPPPQPKDVGE